MWVATMPPPRGRPPSTIRSSPSIAQSTPAALSPAATAARRSLSFTLQFVQAPHPRRAGGEGGGDRQDRIFVDHRGGARGRNVDALEACPRAPASPRPPRRLRRRRSSVSIWAPISFSVVEKPGPERVHHHRPRRRCPTPERSGRRRWGTPPTRDRPERRRSPGAIPAGRRA